MSNEQLNSAVTPHYDVIVIGAGPAGYISAIRCAQLGLKTACIDNWSDANGNPYLGGAYLNSGCVASMTLLESAKIYASLQDNLKQHGITTGPVSLDVKQMMQRKESIIAETSKSIADLFKAHGIVHIHARAKLLSEKLIEVFPVTPAHSFLVEASHIILATGSSPIAVKCAPIDNELIINTATALKLQEVPKRLAFIGAGIKGLEIASIWQRLGAETILLEAQETFLSLADQQIAREAYRIYSAQGLKLHLGARVISAKKDSQKVIIEFQDHEGTHTIEVDKLIVSSGRKPNSENLAAPEANLLLDESGYVHVDENCRTNLPGVYAIGDLTLLGPMLAHKGIEEGVFVAEQIAGLQSPINYHLLPSVVYTDPEIAWVGQTEQALRALGENIKVGVFPFSASVKARSTGNTDGMIKIIADATNDTILGVHIIGNHASELIAEAVLAMEFSASSEDLARTIHAHPTLSEALHEAALMIKDKALHLP